MHLSVLKERKSIEEILDLRDLARVETTFSALTIQPNLIKSASMHGDFARSRKSDEDKIEEGVALLVKKENDGKNFFNYWTCNEFGHYASKCPKREKNYRGQFKPRRSRDFQYANKDEESNQSRSDDELGFVDIKEDDFDREIREQRALISQVEKKSNWIIDSGCSH